MTTWFVTRHPGALVWLQRQGLSADRVVSHLMPEEAEPGDIVIGIFPVNLIADLCARGVRYLHLSVRLPPEFRGVELSCEQLEQLGATIEEFRVERVEP